METNDLVTKEFEAYPDVSADIINALIHDGMPKLCGEELLPAPTESIYQGADGTLHNQLEDVAKYRMRDGRPIMLYFLANQSLPDQNMIYRTAGYIGGEYRRQYIGQAQGEYPVMELVLYWGERAWNGCRSIHEMFRKSDISLEEWQRIDDIHVNIWEMRRLPPETREKFVSDMRIVVDYLAEGNVYRSDRRIIHKEALIKMLRVLSGDQNVNDTAEILREFNIKEEDEITMCELFDQYTRKGKIEGGAESLILDNLEEGRSEEVIISKLMHRFSMDEVTAMKYIEKYAGVTA